MFVLVVIEEEVKVIREVFKISLIKEFVDVMD